MSVSDQNLEEKIKEILSDPSSNGITPKDVRLKLEAHFNTEYFTFIVIFNSLTDRKKDIKQLIEKVISEQDEEV